MSLPEQLTPEEEFALSKLAAMLANFDNPPPHHVLRAALVQLRTSDPDQVAAALPELRQEAIAALQRLRFRDC